MADVWNALGYDRQARMETRRAFKLSSSRRVKSLSGHRARHRECQKEWGQGFEAHQILLAFFPQQFDYGLYLGKAQLDASQPEAAAGHTTRARQLPGRARIRAARHSGSALPAIAATIVGQAIALTVCRGPQRENSLTAGLVARAREQSYVPSWDGTAGASALPLAVHGQRGTAGGRRYDQRRDELRSFYKGSWALETAPGSAEPAGQIENSSRSPPTLATWLCPGQKSGDLALAVAGRRRLLLATTD